jgi:hypothetical protein
MDKKGTKIKNIINLNEGIIEILEPREDIS